MSTDQMLTLPAKAKHTHTLIFLHGLGDSGHGWAPVAAQIQSIYPHIKCILPHAPIAPVTLNGGMPMPSWHDITTLEKIDSENYRGLEESKQRIHAVLNQEIRNGTSSERIILGGFSQGAGLTLYAGYQFPHKLAAFACLSGYLPHNDDFTQKISEANRSTPVFIAHGLKDQVVNPKAGEKVKQVLSSINSIEITYKTYPYLQHSTCPDEMTDLVKFIGKFMAQQ